MTTGRIHLCGGGWSDEQSGAHAPFFAEATARSADGAPRLVVLLWAKAFEDGLRWHQPYRDRYNALGTCEIKIVQLSEDRSLTPVDLDEVDGIVVGGGPTPGYRAAITPQAETIRELIETGVPYSGSSAGAMITPTRALIGGRSVDGKAVAPGGTSDGLDDVTVVAGLGLIEPTIDVHIAQYGSLGRLVALVESGLVDEALGIDEDTVAIVDRRRGDRTNAGVAVVGSGCVWRARRATDDQAGVTVTRHHAGEQM